MSAQFRYFRNPHQFSTALAPDGDGAAFLASHLIDAAETDVESLWASMRPDAPANNATAYDLTVYLFQCLHCGEYLITWDCA